MLLVNKNLRVKYLSSFVNVTIRKFDHSAEHITLNDIKQSGKYNNCLKNLNISWKKNSSK